MSQIFKVNHINGNEIKHIYIFKGSHNLNTDNYEKYLIPFIEEKTKQKIDS